MDRRWKRALWATILSLVAFDRALQWGALADGKLLGRRVVPFDPPLFFDRQEDWVRDLEAHLSTGRPPLAYFGFDRELGWCPTPNVGSGTMHFDRAGARVGIVPRPDHRTDGVGRVVAVGCSFTRGDEVQDDEAWPALLDRDADTLEVVNLGVGAYGIDQAILRMERDAWFFEPDEVWIGIMPYATSRVLAQYRPSLQHWSSTPAFKPRFVVGERDELRLIPHPAESPEDLLHLLTDQASFLSAVEHDRFVGAFPWAWETMGDHWCHRFGLTRVLGTYLESRKDESRTRLGDPRSELFRTVMGICRRGRERAEVRGCRFRVLILPSRRDLRWREADGVASWDPLVEGLAEEGISALDLTDALLAGGALEDPGFWMPGVHYSPLGNRVVAEALHGAFGGD